MTIKVKKLDETAVLPARAHQGDAGLDLCANAETTIGPGEWALIPTGVALALPDGFEAQVRPRSGLAFKYGVTTLNSPGTIDAGYRGEIKALMINHGKEPFTVKKGDRVAQLVIAQVVQAELEEAPELPGSERGAGGFGSTGA
ncbi:MAG: dUTP diphosphatase [Clostridiales bacterium]|jgi:dUTP pyrophosphatase|nr:dUTP diphosphatase [Clostridiales bacterium]